MNVLMIGDAMGKPARRAIATLLPNLRRDLDLDLVIANGENAAAGYGLTPKTADDLLRSGVDVITSGNHIWDNREVFSALTEERPILRPINYPAGVPGQGVIRHGRTVVLNLIGRVFMNPSFDDPFRAADQALAEVEPGTPVIVDIHAEATSEKVALAWYLDGRVSAIFGTHTHVPTADGRILPGGTAYVSDVGMVGARRSVIGTEIEPVLNRFLTGMPTRLPVAEYPEVMFNAVLVTIDDSSGRAVDIQRVDREVTLP